MAKILAICVSEKRNEPKRLQNEASFIPGGIEGDSHYGLSEREVSLLRREDIEDAEQKAGFSFPPGSLAENLVVEGLPSEIPSGALLQIGRDVILQVVGKGKKPGEPHSYDYKGWCLLPLCGYFLKVLRGGTAFLGDEVIFR
ncbi:MOSC domain-containing protein [Aminobacterium mobile]|uniref:MOSC domain-containing protein n=1 Tax=Aminobacterium mobile TaxID=81467 RepID=UPI00331549E4